MLAAESYLICVISYVAPVKILSKKEQKRLEDEEFERTMNEMGSSNANAEQPAAATN